MSDRQDFITAFHTDAYAAMLTRTWADAWALGYEAAKRDAIQVADGRGYVQESHPLYPVLRKLDEDGFSKLRRRAEDELLERECKSVASVAALASLLDRDLPVDRRDFTPEPAPESGR